MALEPRCVLRSVSFFEYIHGKKKWHSKMKSGMHYRYIGLLESLHSITIRFYPSLGLGSSRTGWSTHLWSGGEEGDDAGTLNNFIQQSRRYDSITNIHQYCSS